MKPTGLLLAALASMLVAGLLVAVYPHLVAHDAPNAVLTATNALIAGAWVAAPVLVVAAIVRGLAR